MDHTMIDQGTHFSSYVMQLCSLLVAQGILRRVCLQGLVVSEKTFFFFFFLLFLWAAPTAYGGSQARGRIGDVAASLHQSHSNAGIQAASATHTTAHGNTGSSTH